MTVIMTQRELVEISDVLKGCRADLVLYEEDVTGELYNWPRLNRTIDKLQGLIDGNYT